ncbi:MAG: GIY-YIG nuclease family protein [Dechloromonas sp.]|nr:GIY-YIG nuclease family protein [Dechloromonas sp.]
MRLSTSYISARTWFVYLLECVDGSFYTGVATDVAARLAAHEAAKGARYTRSHKPLRLLASAPVGSKSQALKAELAIKRLPKEQKRKRPAVPPVVFHSVGAISGFLRGGGDGKKARRGILAAAS